VKKLILLFPLAAAVLAGCAPSEQRSPHSAATAIQQDLRQHPDAELIAAHPNLMRRRGGILDVRGNTFKDEGDCRL
jgi:hypothetical protein